MTDTLKDFLTRSPRYGISAAAVPYQSTLPTYLRITDISENGRFNPDPRVSVKSPLSGNYCLEDGDLVVARTGASVGKSYRYRIEDGDLVFAGFLIAIHPDARRLDPRYLAFMLQSKAYWDWIDSESTRSGQPGINAQQLSLLPIDVPLIEEQSAIADRLDDVEALEKSLARIITKKRAIKQGIMQELLTGRTRLPGFSDEWTRVRLGDIAVIDPESLSPATTPGSAVIDYISLEEVSRGSILGSTSYHFSDAPSRARRRLRAGDVLFGTVRPNLQSHARYSGNLRNPVASTGFGVIRSRVGAAHSDFIGHWVLSNDVMVQIDRIIAGSNYPAVSSGDLRSLEIALPPVEEQIAIGRVLQDTDSEIDILEHRLEATRAIKKGMMQELSSGRARIVPAVAQV